MLEGSISVWQDLNEPTLWLMEKVDGVIYDFIYYVVYPTPDDPPSERYGNYSAFLTKPTLFGGLGHDFFESYVVYPNPGA